MNTFPLYFWTAGFIKIPRLPVPPSYYHRDRNGHIRLTVMTWGCSLFTKSCQPPSHLLMLLLNSEQCVSVVSQAHNASWSHRKHACPYCPETKLTKLLAPCHECGTNLLSMAPPQKPPRTYECLSCKTYCVLDGFAFPTGNLPWDIFFQSL